MANKDQPLLRSATWGLSGQYPGRNVYVSWNAVEQVYELSVLDVDDDIVMAMAGEFKKVIFAARHFADINQRLEAKMYAASQPPEELISDEVRESNE